MVANQSPNHVDTMIQLSDIFKLSDDLQMAAELIERAIYSLESAFHPLFNVAKGNCRLDYKRQENRFVTYFQKNKMLDLIYPLHYKYKFLLK